MGDLSGTGDDMAEGERIFIDQLNRKFRIKIPVELSDPPADFRIARESKPWRIYRSMLVTVLPTFFLMYASLFLVMGAVSLEPLVILSSSLCSLPLLYIIFRLQRPKLVHVRLAVPDSSGDFVHPLPEGKTLRTPVRTSFSRFLVKDDSILDMPPSKQLWAMFAFVLLIGTSITVLLFQNSSTLQGVGVVLFIFLAIPLWLVGFSLPVLAWWGTSNSQMGIPTRRRDAEAWLIAGMASAFPAFLFNSLVAPKMIPASFPDWAVELSLLAIGAPFCEEIFKAMAVAIFLPAIKGPKHGFQVGFTVGLGFALIENLQYIGVSLFGGPVSATMTILIRGIGSIPGHAVWTAISGTAIGWLATDKEFKAKMEWRARNLAISAIDVAERMGIDTDGDGDLSGFDGRRPTLEEAIDFANNQGESAPKSWLIVNTDSTSDNPDEIPNSLENSGFSLSYDKGSPETTGIGYLTPKGVPQAISIAIFGHSFWNGSSFLSFHATTEWLGFSENSGVLFMLSWIVLLISSVVFVARGLLKGISSMDS